MEKERKKEIEATIVKFRIQSEMKNSWAIFSHDNILFESDIIYFQQYHMEVIDIEI